MATIVNVSKELEIEGVFRNMTDEELQNLLGQEKCLDRRLLLRKELRTRKNSSTASQIHNQIDKSIEAPAMQSSRIKPFAMQPSGYKDDVDGTNKTLSEENHSKPFQYSDQKQNELDGLVKELRNTLDVNKRQELRTKIKELHANADLKSDHLKYDQQLKDKHFKDGTIFTHEPQGEKIMKYSIVNPTQPSYNIKNNEPNLAINSKESTNLMNTKPRIESYNKKSENSLVLKTSNVKENLGSNIIPNEKGSNQVLDAEVKESKPLDSAQVHYKINNQKENESKSKNYQKCKIKITEMEDVVLEYRVLNEDYPQKDVTWFLNNMAIEKYPKSYFNNIKFSDKEGPNIKLQFSDASIRKHQGIFRLEVNSKPSFLEVSFEVIIEKKESDNITKTQPMTDTKGTSSNKFITNNTSKLENNLDSNMKASDIMNISEICPLETKKVNVSRVSSMREMFEKKPDTNICRSNTNRDIKRKVAVQPLADRELENIIKEHSTVPLENKVTASLKESGACSSTLTPPSQPARKISQTGILKMIPMMKSKAKIARSSIQQMKDLIINFCKYNTQEYENVNITNYSGSWADGLAFCALIHHFYPDSFDYSKLKPENRIYNFNLAFETASKRGEIDPLLDADDMIILDNPDWKCVYTYLQLVYSKLKTHPRNVMPKTVESHP